MDDDGQELVTCSKKFGRYLTPIVGDTAQYRLNKQKEPRDTWELWPLRSHAKCVGRQNIKERGRFGIRFKTSVERIDRMDES